MSRWRGAIVAVSIALFMLPVAACGGDDDSDSDAPAATAPAATEAAPVREGTDAASGSVSRAEAEQAALTEVGEGSVTWSAPEDDRGAAWEVEITRSDGTQVDVLVAADGSIVKQVDKFGSAPATEGGGTPPPGGVVSQAEAEEAALAAVEGRVTFISREDERGAAWEVEITRPDGSEVDVLVAADGTVID